MATKKIYLDNALISQNTSSYNDLYALPSINGVTLQGEITSDELNLYNKQQVDNLIASSKNVKVVPTVPSTPLQNTQYFVGPDANGKYHIYIYDKDLNRIDLGSTDEIDFEIYQEKQPTHTGTGGKVIYDIGHTDGEADNRILTNHTVAGAINEIDSALQRKQNSEDNTLRTSAKTVVGSINELKERADGLATVMRTISIPKDEAILEGRYRPIATITKRTVRDTSNLSATFLLATDWGGTIGGMYNQEYSVPVHLQLNIQTNNGVFQCSSCRPLTAVYQHPTRSLLRYNSTGYILVTWNSDKVQIWYYDKFYDTTHHSLSAKIIVLDEDVGDGLELKWAEGGTTKNDPRLGNNITYTWQQLGYTNMTT